MTKLQVDVLRAVTGLTTKDLAVTESITFTDGKSYSVPAPDVMLKAKLANLATHDQRSRQDERHVRILIRCNAHYLTEVCAAVRQGELPEREAVERFMATQRVIAHRSSRQLDQKFALQLSEAIPAQSALGELTSLPRIRAFFEHQIDKRSEQRLKCSKKDEGQK